MTTLTTPVRRQPAVDSAAIDYTVLTKVEPSRLSAYLELAKARIAVMVLFSMGVGFVLASEGLWQPAVFVHACIGVFLAVVSSSTLNQYLERHTDGKMLRTAKRPLPMGKLTAGEVLLFGLLTGTIGVLYLLVMVNVTTALLTLATIFLYVAAYTPLKRVTPFCTVIGAIPGAAPPVLGWTAAGGELGLAAFSLFAILFVWQFPHFLAIAWMYHDQYKNAGLRMVPGRGRSGVVGAVSLAYALVLIPVSLLPMQLDLAGVNYAVVAVLVGLAYAFAAFLFQREESRQRARQLLWVSLAYLPCLQMSLILDHLRLLS